MKTEVVIIEPDFYARETILSIILRDSRLHLLGCFDSNNEIRKLAVRNPPSDIVCILTSTEQQQCLQQHPYLHYILLINDNQFLSLSPIDFSLFRAILVRKEIQYSLCNAILYALSHTKPIVSPSIIHTMQKKQLPFLPFFHGQESQLPQHLKPVAYLKYYHGFTNSQIENALFLSKHTLYDYLKQIKEVLGVSGKNSQTQCYIKLLYYSISDAIVRNPQKFRVG